MLVTVVDQVGGAISVINANPIPDASMDIVMDPPGSAYAIPIGEEFFVIKVT